MAEPHRESERKGVANFKAGAAAAGSAEEMELVVTISSATGEIVKFEKVDKAGKRHELSEEDCAKLAGKDEVEEIDAALEEAFEAGIAGVLGEEDEEDEYDEYDDEDEDESALRGLLTGGLRGRSLVRRRLRRRLVHRLLLRRLFRRRLLKRRHRLS
jgi:hypothetical protein